MATLMKLTTGRRKEAVARVRLTPGSGEFLINGRALDEYFPTRVHRMVAQSPLRSIGRDKEFDVVASITGGGVNGQAGALRLGHRSCAPRARPGAPSPAEGRGVPAP